MSNKPVPLRMFDFGRLDASDEATHDPALLLEGYFDYNQAVYSISNGLAWYVLGPKGAGKSAVFEHLRLKWEGRYDRFFVSWDLRGFPVADVGQIRTGQSAGASRAQSAWEFLLLLRIYQSLQTDQGISAPPEFFSLVSELKRAGLLLDDFSLSVTKWSTGPVSFRGNLGFFGIEVGHKEVSPLEISAVLRAGLERARTENKHIVTIDGLDSFFLESDDDFASLAGLVHAIEAVNRFLAATEVTAHVAAAIRTEAFDALESTDSNKLKSHCVYLDWSPSGVGPDSKLWDLVDTKCRVSGELTKSFASTYLSVDIGQGPYTNIPHYFLAYTRLLPRDVTALLTHLQLVHPGATAVLEREAVSAVQNYAEQYFVGEVSNNLAGILPKGAGRQAKTLAFLEALKGVSGAEFTLHELQQLIDGDLSESESKVLLRQLFQIGAIGIRTTSESGYQRTDFTYRRANSVAFNPRRVFLLHNALIVAWNKAR